ncbi:MAG: Holliday junction resolvase RuvX [Actinomycetota bacterium]
MGLDPGERRIGVAVADLETRFARPYEVIDRQSGDAVGRVIEIVVEVDADCIVVGRPVGLSGHSGPAVEAQGRFVDELRSRSPVEIREYDERFTTVVAESAMRQAGVSPERRKRLRDAVAAQVMLQGFMDAGS